MKQNMFKPRHCRSALIVLGSLVLAVFVACLDTRVIGQTLGDNLPKINQVMFIQTNEAKYSIKQAQVISTDGSLRMADTKTLYSGYWGEGTSEYKMSPDDKQLLVSQEVPSSDVSKEHSNLLLVPVPTDKTKTLRDDEAGYQMLGWSPDGQLISYVSPITIPFSNALAPTPPGFQLISYVSNKSIPESRQEHPDRILYISSTDGKWRQKVQAKVSDAVWVPGGKVIVYTSYERPGLVVYSPDGKNAILSKDAGGGSLMLSGDGRKLLWSDGSKLLRQFEVPRDSSKLLDPKAWKTVAEFNLDPNRPNAAVGLSHDGTMVALRGPDIQTLVSGDGIQSSTRLAVLNLVTKRSVVYSLVGNMYRLGWSQDGRYLVGGYFQPSKNGESADLAVIQVDQPSSISHTGTIKWDNPQPVTPQILLEMPLQTKSITWRE